MTQDNFQKQVLDRLDALNNDVKQISKDNEKFSDRFTNYGSSGVVGITV